MSQSSGGPMAFLYPLTCDRICTDLAHFDDTWLC